MKHGLGTFDGPTHAAQFHAVLDDVTASPLDPDELSQLEKELASYKEKKPWREQQEEQPSADDDEDKTTPDESQAPERTIDF